MRHRGREPALRAGEPEDRPLGRATTATSRAACRSRATSPTSPAASGSGSSPRTATARRSRSPGPGCSGVRSSTSSTTSTASCTSTISTRWTSCWRSARATRTTPRSARRRAPWRDRAAGPRPARADRLHRQRRVRPAGAPRAWRPIPTIDLVGVVTAPPRPAGRGADTGPDADHVRGDRARGRPRPDAAPACAIDDAVAEVLALDPALIVLADYGRIVPAALLGLRARRPQPPSVAPAAASRRHAGPGHDPGRRRDDRGQPHPDGRGRRHGPDRGPGADRRRPDETAPELETRLADDRRGSARRPRSVRGSRGDLPPEPQAEAVATMTRPLRREDGRLDPTRSAVELERQVRAYQPWPGSFLDTARGRLTVWHAAAGPSEHEPAGRFGPRGVSTRRRDARAPRGPARGRAADALGRVPARPERRSSAPLAPRADP